MLVMKKKNLRVWNSVSELNTSLIPRPSFKKGLVSTVYISLTFSLSDAQGQPYTGAQVCYIVTVSMSCIDGPAENVGIEIDLLVCYLATTVGAKIKFTFRFCTTVVLRYEPCSKNGVKFLLRKRSTHCLYGFRTGETHVYNSCIACQILFIL